MTTNEIVRTWFGERIATGAVARDTEAYNQVTAALPDLIARLEASAAMPAAALVEPAVPEQPAPAASAEPAAPEPTASPDRPAEAAADDHPAA